MRWFGWFRRSAAEVELAAAEWRGYAGGYASGLAVGMAQGELRGRMLLAAELEQMFPEHRPGIEFEDAQRIRVRQVH